jgi:zinc protease
MKTIQILYLIIFITLASIIMNGCQKNESVEKPDNAVLLPVADDPTISFRIWFKVGSQNDFQGKEGLALLTANMLTDGGTKNNSYQQIVEKLYPMAASYSAVVDKEMTVIYGRVHKDNIDKFYTLFTDAILKPAFKEEDFNRIKSNMLNYLEKELRYSSDEELGKSALYNFIFSETSYGHITEGTIEGIKSISIDDIKNFYKKYFTCSNFVIGIGGGYDNSLPGKLAQDLQSLPNSNVVQSEKPKISKIEGYEFQLIEKDCDATAISFGFPISFLRSDNDFYALALFNSWFGEHRNSSSHLYQVIRERRGLNYGDYSYIEAFLQGGMLQLPEPNHARRQQIFEVWLRPVSNSNRHFALRASIRELKNVIDKGMTKEEFELTKKFLNKYALHFAPTTMRRLGYQIDSKFYNVNDDGNYIEYFRKKINELTLNQVNDAIRKYLQYENIKFAIVTKDAEKFRDELIKDSPSPIKYDTPKPDKILAEDKEIEVFPIKVNADKIRIVKLEEMFLK